jgi:hypothetical protein
MAHEIKHIRRQKIRYDSDNDGNPLTAQLVIDGVKKTAASATITIFGRGNSTALLAATPMTLSGSLLLYPLDTSTTATWPVATGYRAELAITYDGTIYVRHFIFDICKYILHLGITYDTLVDLDDSLLGMQWRGTTDFSGVVVAMRDVLQSKIEAKVIADERLIENMILDESGVAVAAQYGILAQAFRSKIGNEEKVEFYQSMHESMLSMVLSSIRYDKGQDGDEDDALNGLSEVTLKL